MCAYDYVEFSYCNNMDINTEEALMLWFIFLNCAIYNFIYF